MSAADLISRLEGVKQTGTGSWIARCPAHADRSPSLSVREKDGGLVLIRCFADCPKEDILAAVGLEWSHLFPEQAASDHVRPERRPFNALDVLRCVAFEILVGAVVLSSLSRGEEISERDRERVLLAASRLGSAADLAGAA